MVDKRFKIIPKGEKFKWNLPSSMTNYVNLHFQNYIPDKDINKKILTRNPVPSNLQELHRCGCRYNDRCKGSLFFYQGFFSQTVTIHKTAAEEGRGQCFILLCQIHLLRNIQTFVCEFAREIIATFF